MTFAPLTAFADRIDRLNTAVGRAVAWLALVVLWSVPGFATALPHALYGR